MKKLDYNKCDFKNSTICYDFILTGTDEIITLLNMKERCIDNCEKRSICKVTLEALKEWKRERASELLTKYINLLSDTI